MYLAFRQATSDVTGHLVEDEGTPAVVYAQAATVVASAIGGLVNITAVGLARAATAAGVGSRSGNLLGTGNVTAGAAIALGTGTVGGGTAPIIINMIATVNARPATVATSVVVLSAVIAEVFAQAAWSDADVVVLQGGGIEIEAEVFADFATVTGVMNEDLWIEIRVKASDWVKIYPEDV